MEDLLVKATTEVRTKLQTLGIEETLAAEIEWCIGSYKADKNPTGLQEKAQVALTTLNEYKKSNPRKVSKKLIADLEKAVSLN